MTEIGFKGPGIMKQIRKTAIALCSRGSKVCVCSHRRMRQKAIRLGQAQQPLINNEAERQTPGQMYCYIIPADMWGAAR